MTLPIDMVMEVVKASGLRDLNMYEERISQVLSHQGVTLMNAYMSGNELVLKVRIVS